MNREPIADIAVVGAGAAGLMAALQAADAVRDRGGSARIVALDGTPRLGAKILIAGGGRCNVTHHEVKASDFAGSSPAAISRILRRFDVPATVEFFAGAGVTLKREETGKLFPVTDRARTVLDALLRAARDRGIELLHPWRVERIEQDGDEFVLHRTQGGPGQAAPLLRARRVILATGGRSVPKTGSDGQGYELARSLGHGTTPRILPGLVPLLLRDGHFLRELRGVSFPARLVLVSATGKHIRAMAGSVLCTHFGLSGPLVLDMSRHYLHAVLDDPGARLRLDVLPGRSDVEVDAALAALGSRSPVRYLHEALPERLARALCIEAGIDPSLAGNQLPREARRRLVRTVTALELPITGDRGFTHAEVTAGGVPLAELHLDTLASRVVPGLHLCGEICDVDGRIGGFNFQWAWASGWVAGRGAAGGGSLGGANPLSC